MRYLLALDQGTSSSRSLVLNEHGTILATAQQELPQMYPQPGWVEHDALCIWRDQVATARSALAQAGLRADQIHAVGITNQRETTLLWNRRTGQPLHHAIVWQDRRGAAACDALRAQGWAEPIRASTGLVLDSYFSATKLKWLLDNLPGARAQAAAGELAFGTIDCWLIWQLTGGAEDHTRAQARHVTDVSNAARTMLFNIHTNQWDDALLAALDIPRALLPTVQASASWFGDTTPKLLGAAIPITGAAGDQQSALFGQACFTPGMVKNTYGTGCFMLMHTGTTCPTSQHGLIATRTAQTGATSNATNRPTFALEGSVFMGGAVVQWLRDGLHAIPNSGAVQALAASVPDTDGVMLVPAFTGLGAPYWRADARGSITGLTRGSTLAHIARAALESIAFQSADLLQAMQCDLPNENAPALTELRVDGGACANDLLMQFQADLLGIPVVRPRCIETTALGAAWLAGLGSGLYASTDEVAGLWRAERRFLPERAPGWVTERMARWHHAVQQTLLGT